MASVLPSLSQDIGVFPQSGDVPSSPGSSLQQGRGIQNSGGSVSIGSVSFYGYNDGPAAKGRKEALIKLLSYDTMSNREEEIERSYRQTCTWILDCPQWLEWRKRPSSLLWIKGNPGAGKSTMVKFALRNMTRLPNERIVSHFFNARGDHLEKSAEGLYRTLLAQLLQDVSPSAITRSNALAKAADRPADKKWTIPTLLELLEQVVKIIGAGPTTVFLDALDECNPEQLQDIVDCLCDLLEEVAPGTELRICFASRHFPHVTREGALDLLLEKHAGHYEDVRSYIDGQLSSSKMHLHEELKDRLQKKAAGSFIWAFLVIRILKKEYRKGRVARLEAQLENLPDKLEELYRDILDRDRNLSAEETLMCFRWVLLAQRSLRPAELWCAVRLSAVRGSSGPSLFHEYSQMDETDVERWLLDISRGLVADTGSETRVQFIHETARAFLWKETGLESTDEQARAHELFKQCCWEYLLSEPPDLSPAVTISVPLDDDAPAEPLSDVLDEHVLFTPCAVESILYHAEQAQGSDIGQSSFLTELWNNEAIRTRLATSEGSLITTLMSKGMFYLMTNCQIMLDSARCEPRLGLDPEGNTTAIESAISHGHLRAVFALMDLHVRRSTEHPELFDLLKLLKTRVYDSWNRSSDLGVERFFARKQTSIGPLCHHPDAIWFLASGREDVATFFLVSVIPPTSSIVAPSNLTRLTEVALEGFPQVLEYILSQGLTTGPSTFSASVALCWAAARGHAAIARILLDEHNPDIRFTVLTPWEKERTALDLASEEGHIAVVKLILESTQATSGEKDHSFHGHLVASEKRVISPHDEIFELFERWRPEKLLKEFRKDNRWQSKKWLVRYS